jgi:hypothetical protein
MPDKEILCHHCGLLIHRGTSNWIHTGTDRYGCVVNPLDLDYVYTGKMATPKRTARRKSNAA